MHGFRPSIGTLDSAAGKIQSGGPTVIITVSFEGKPPPIVGNVGTPRRADLDDRRARGQCPVLLRVVEQLARGLAALEKQVCGIWLRKPRLGLDVSTHSDTHRRVDHQERRESPCS